MAQRQAQGPLLTIREASQATGLSIKALRGRVERGSLHAVTLGGRRRIALSELLAAGLLRTEPDGTAGRRSRRKRGTSSGYPAGMEDGVGTVILERLDQLTERVTTLTDAVERLENAVSRQRQAGG
jgi:hypothetical protein